MVRGPGAGAHHAGRRRLVVSRSGPRPARGAGGAGGHLPVCIVARHTGRDRRCDLASRAARRAGDARRRGRRSGRRRHGAPRQDRHAHRGAPQREDDPPRQRRRGSDARPCRRSADGAGGARHRRCAGARLAASPGARLPRPCRRSDRLRGRPRDRRPRRDGHGRRSSLAPGQAGVRGGRSIGPPRTDRRADDRGGCDDDGRPRSHGVVHGMRRVARRCRPHDGRLAGGRARCAHRER